jgi:DNA-directed RNA polymerase specialized sigma24 family protein
VPTAAAPGPLGQHVPNDDITGHLVAVHNGGQPELDALFTVVYNRLKARARSYGASIDATELVHEAYLKFVDSTRTNWNDRQHFFAVSARAMRQIVVDHARRQGTAKRGSGFRLTTLGDKAVGTEASAATVLAVHEALDALGMSARTVKREWQKPKMLLGACWHQGPRAVLVTLCLIGPWPPWPQVFLRAHPAPIRQPGQRRARCPASRWRLPAPPCNRHGAPAE